MSELETNIHRITNLRDLASTYRTYRVVNLHRDQEEYFQNCQQLTRKLSFKLRSPAAVIDRKDEAILVVKQDAPEPPKEMFVVRAQVQFELMDENIHLDYTPEARRTTRSPSGSSASSYRALCTIGWTCGNPDLGSPSSSGNPTGRVNNWTSSAATRSAPSSLRPATLAVRGRALQARYRRSLPPILTARHFSGGKGAHVIYHFGLNWLRDCPSGVQRVKRLPI